MDIEKLTKAQIILLTLLVSFVTSIATGIVTVTLLEQAPSGVTQTINRVVERTVERVSAPTTTPEQNIVREETTVVVKEQDLITESIEKNSARLVRLYEKTTGAETGAFVSLGVIVDERIAAVPAQVVEEGEVYDVFTSDGTRMDGRAARVNDGNASALIVIEPDQQIADAIESPAAFADLQNIKRGHTTIALSGSDRTRVSLGIISDIVTEITEGENASARIVSIATNIATGEISTGTPVFNMFGELLGLKAAGQQGAPADDMTITPVTQISAEIEAYQSGAAE